MRIKELAGTTGVPVETIRYYEKAGLLPEPPRQYNGYRQYGSTHRERLAFIRHCRELGMPLADVQRLLDYAEHPADDCADIDRLIDEQIARVHERVLGLQQLERQLGVLRAQCEATHEGHAGGECGILNELLSAAQDEGCACHGPQRQRVAQIERDVAERALPADADPDDPASRR